jgi:hypothetical protein
MQMMAIVFRKSLEDEIFQLLRDCRVPGFTDVAEVWGAGETGAVFDSFVRPGVNSLVFAALDEAESERLVAALREFRGACVARQRGAPLPLRVFLLPCTQAL